MGVQWREKLSVAGRGLVSWVKSIPFSSKRLRVWILISLGVVVLFMIVLSLIWGRAPRPFDVRESAMTRAQKNGDSMVTGYVVTATVATIADKMLHKSGGYMTNDVMPPTAWMDDIPNWEFGVLMQIRDSTDTLRNSFSRSLSQSLENPELAQASPLFNYSNDSWIFPSTESQYRKAVRELDAYLQRLSRQDQQNAQFYARADNLSKWLERVEVRLGGISQRLSASVGQVRANTDLAGDPAATQATPASSQVVEKTSWWDIDDVFFEARGYTWATLHMLRAVRIDFEEVLEKKNATAMVDQIIRELEGSQRRVWSPMILNGSGFGFFANHSLVMASYVSRANAAVIDLRELLSQG